MNAVAEKFDDIYPEIDRYQDQIDKHQFEIKKIAIELSVVNAELEAFDQERQRFSALNDVCDSLDKLKQVGADDLFWNEKNSKEADIRLEQLREQIDLFENKIKKYTDRKDACLNEIKEREDEIECLFNEIEQLKEYEEERRYEFVTQRELRLIPYRVTVMPWTKNDRDEKEYRKILLITLLICLVLGVLIPLYKITLPEKVEVVEVQEYLTRLIEKEKPKPKIEKKQSTEVTSTEKKPTKEKRKEAREKTKSKGVLAFKNNFAKLLEEASLDKLGANANLSNAGSTATKTQRSILTSQAKNTSTGISSTKLSRNIAGTGDEIVAVAFTRVESEIGTALEDDRPLSDGPGPSRTDEEIQIVFDKYKAALYRIYNRELRVNPTLQGKVILRITIEPDGSVSLTKVESTDMDAKKMLDEVVARVKRFNFGAKEGVPTITILYPIDFLPAS